MLVFVYEQPPFRSRTPRLGESVILLKRTERKKQGILIGQAFRIQHSKTNNQLHGLSRKEKQTGFLLENSIFAEIRGL